MAETTDKMELRVNEVFEFCASEITAAMQLQKLNPEIAKLLEKDIDRVLNKKVKLLAEKLDKKYDTKFTEKFIDLMSGILIHAWAYEESLFDATTEEDDTNPALH